MRLSLQKAREKGNWLPNISSTSMKRDLVLLDRGYPAFWLFKLILFS